MKFARLLICFVDGLLLSRCFGSDSPDLQARASLSEVHGHRR